MPGIEEGEFDAVTKLDWLIISGGSSELIQRIKCIFHRVERRGFFLVPAMPLRASVSIACFLLLEMRCIENNKPRKLTRCGGRDDLACEAALGKKRQASAVIQVSVREQDIVDCGGVKAKRSRVLFVELMTTLIKTAVDQNALSGALDHVARAGYTAVSAMERYSQDTLLKIWQR